MATYHLRVKDDTKRSGFKVSPKRHADYILREEGQAHADYINREGAQSDRNDCIFKGSQLPKWAKGSPQKFFSAATRYEDKGNYRYKEIELSLPNELTLEQNREIVDRFLANHLANHYYAYAIHEKAGELSGERHPHVHIMFSERIIDDVERTSERPACKYFRRAAKPLRGEQIASFERRCQHGAPKDKKWHSKKFFFEMREDFARIQNEVLAKNGYSIRVDHRTLNAQRVEAERHGDDFLAKVYKRVPESYIGIVPAHAEDSRVADLKRYREQKQSKQTSLFNTDLKQKSTEEAETKFLVRQAEYASLALLNSQAYKSANLENESLRVLNQGILAGLERIKKLTRELVGVLCAHQRAQKEYLSVADHSFLIDYENKLRQRDNLQRLLSQLIPPPEKQTENRQAFHAIQLAITKKISDLRFFLAENNSRFWETKRKLDEPYLRKNVELVVHGILQRNLEVLNELKKTSTDVLKHVDALRDKLEVREKTQTTFTAKEIRDSLYQQYRSLHRQYEQVTEHRNRLMFKVISPCQALEIANNIFLHGDLKKFHAEQESYKETSAQYERDLTENCKREIFFKNTDWTNHGVKFQEQYYITKENFRLETIRKNLAQTKSHLDSESVRLKTLCQNDDAQEKIALIAAAILRKDLKTAQEYEKTKKLLGNLLEKMQEAEKRFKAFDNGYSRLKKNYVYRVIQSETNPTKISTSNKNELVAIIADALLAESYALPLVARLDGKFLEMEKDWELMSELDKDELIQKQIVREL